jgi:hypothetical protein
MAEWPKASGWKPEDLLTEVRGFDSHSYRQFMNRVLRWLKAMFYENQEPEKVVSRPVVLNESSSVHILDYQKQLHCRLHENYSGATEPINNCNVCWEIYSEKRKKW